MSALLFKRPKVLASHLVRGYRVFRKSEREYTLPWERPNPSVDGAVVIHVDASYHKGTGGCAVGWVTRDSSGNILDQHYKWIENVSKSHESQWLALIECTKYKPKVGVKHTICCDDDGVVSNLKKAVEGQEIKNPNMKEPAETVWEQLKKNFPYNHYS